MPLPGTVYTVEVNPRIPQRLARLSELAGNLWYSFDRPTRALFARLHPALWDAVGHSPKAMLKRIDEARLTAAASDPVFLNNFNRVLSAYDTYMNEPLARPPSPMFCGTILVCSPSIIRRCVRYSHCSPPKPRAHAQRNAARVALP